MATPPSSYKQGFFITGTDTGVGKTVITACLLSLFKKHGMDVGVMKPLETGVDPECSSAANSDALFLMELAGTGDPLAEVSPFRFKPAASPCQAARLENRSIEPGKIVRGLRQLADRHELMLVEGIGGLLVPITPTYFVCDLVRDLGLPLLVVARVTLGTLNHTLLTLRVAIQMGIEVRGVLLNHLEPGEGTGIEKNQGSILTEISGIPIVGECPFMGPVSEKNFTPERLNRIEEWLDFDYLMENIVRSKKE
ncbi:MAG: dethiobiotin synthase [Nitrospinaceae bacterium]